MPSPPIFAGAHGAKHNNNSFSDPDSGLPQKSSSKNNNLFEHCAERRPQAAEDNQEHTPNLRLVDEQRASVATGSNYDEHDGECERLLAYVVSRPDSVDQQTIVLNSDFIDAPKAMCGKHGDHTDSNDVTDVTAAGGVLTVCELTRYELVADDHRFVVLLGGSVTCDLLSALTGECTQNHHRHDADFSSDACARSSEYFTQSHAAASGYNASEKSYMPLNNNASSSGQRNLILPVSRDIAASSVEVLRDADYGSSRRAHSWPKRSDQRAYTQSFLENCVQEPLFSHQGFDEEATDERRGSEHCGIHTRSLPPGLEVDVASYLSTPFPSHLPDDSCVLTLNVAELGQSQTPTIESQAINDIHYENNSDHSETSCVLTLNAAGLEGPRKLHFQDASWNVVGITATSKIEAANGPVSHVDAHSSPDNGHLDVLLKGFDEETTNSFLGLSDCIVSEHVISEFYDSLSQNMKAIFAEYNIETFGSQGSEMTWLSQRHNIVTPITLCVVLHIENDDYDRLPATCPLKRYKWIQICSTFLIAYAGIGPHD